MRKINFLNLRFNILIYFGVSAFSVHAAMNDAPTIQSESFAFQALKNKATLIEEKRQTDGLAYIISGGIALSISIPGYYLSQDVFARSVYSLGQSLGVASVGYGSYLKLIDDETIKFYKIISTTPLSATQREALSYSYLKATSETAKNARKIRVISHGLTAALNILNGVTSENTNLQTALYFLGGINTLAAFSFMLTESEEEKAFKDLQISRKPSRSRTSLSVEVGISTAALVIKF